MGSTSVTSPLGSEISPLERPDNELSSYRAISATAVVSMIFGLLSTLSFATPWFWIAAILAIVLGVQALRFISRQPDSLTGTSMARLGITLGLIFGLSSAVWGFVDDFMLKRRATNFVVSNLLPILNSRDLNAALYYKEEPATRRGVTPEEFRAKIDKEIGPDNQFMFEQRAGSVAKLNRHLTTEKDAKLEFQGIEKTVVEGTTPVALALVRVEWPQEAAHSHDGDHDHDSDQEKAHEAFVRERGEMVGVVIKNKREGRRDNWWVDTYIYPYTGQGYTAKVKPVDDGHGHGPGGH